MAQTYVTIVVTLDGEWQKLNLDPAFADSTTKATLCKSIAIQGAAGNSNPVYVSGLAIDGTAPPDANQGIYLPAATGSVPVAPFVIGNNSGGQNATLLESVYVRGTAAETVNVNVEVYP